MKKSWTLKSKILKLMINNPILCRFSKRKFMTIQGSILHHLPIAPFSRNEDKLSNLVLSHFAFYRWTIQQMQRGNHIHTWPLTNMDTCAIHEVKTMKFPVFINTHKYIVVSYVPNLITFLERRAHVLEDSQKCLPDLSCHINISNNQIEHMLQRVFATPFFSFSAVSCSKYH